MLGQNDETIYLNISEGKIVQRKEGKTLRFDYVEGQLERIYRKDREFRGEKVPYIYIDLRDSETGTLYSLGVNAEGGVWRGIILSLGSCPEFISPIKICPYVKGAYTRAVVYSGGVKMSWVEGLPPVAEVQVGSKTIKDVSQRENFIAQIVERINNALGA